MIATTTLADVVTAVGPAPVRRSARSAAAEGVRDATRTLESAQQRRQREERELLELEEAANVAQAQADHEAATLAALENASRDSPFPLSKDQWTAHVYSGLCPAFNYFMERVAEGPDGDRFAAVELFRAFRIFNPSYAKTLSRKDAFALIEKLDHYPIFRQGGDWNAYKQ